MPLDIEQMLQSSAEGPETSDVRVSPSLCWTGLVSVLVCISLVMTSTPGCVSERLGRHETPESDADADGEDDTGVVVENWPDGFWDTRSEDLVRDTTPQRTEVDASVDMSPLDVVAASTGPPIECHDGSDGDWVCVWSSGEWDGSGPCAFGRDGDVWASGLRYGTSMLLRFTHYSADGDIVHDVAYAGRSTPNTNTLTAEDLLVDSDGTVIWGGQKCSGSGLYCLDAVIRRLSPEGVVRSGWRFGSPAGLDRVTALEFTSDGDLLLAATYDTFELADRTIQSRGGSDHLVMRTSPSGEIRWIQTWGSTSSDANGIDLATNDSGRIAVVGNFGGRPGEGGFVSLLDDAGVVAWTLGAEVYLPRVGLDGEQNVVVPELEWARFDSSGALVDRLREPDGFWDLDRVGGKRWLVSTHSRSRVGLISDDGLELRTHAIPGAETRWYRGGQCLGPDGQAAISGSIRTGSSFGILDAPIAVPEGERLNFVLYLRDFF